jgi:alpha-glucosidase
MADFGYDVADHCDVDPLFGTLDDFDRLLEACHRRGMRVIIDWVPNHTSDRHPWFRAARSGRDDPRRDWYVWRDPAPGGGPPNDWRSSFGRVGPAWTLDEATGQYYLHSFLPGQPDLNWWNPAVEAAMLDTLRFWLDRGVDGFRIDVVHRLGTTPDPPAGTRRWSQTQEWPHGHEILRRVRRVLEEYEDRMAVGEVYVLDQARLVRFVNPGDELHLAHNFVFLNTPWRAERFAQVIDEFALLVSDAAWGSWGLNNHDHSRVATRYAGGGDGTRRARAAAVLVLTLRGTPFLYQGEELGLPDADVPPERVVDVDGRDPARAPMPWRRPSDAGPGAGFTRGEPWLPIVAGAEHLAVAAQTDDPASTLSLYRRLIALRRESPALHSGFQRRLEGGADVLAYERTAAGERLLVAINFASGARPLAVDGLGGLAATVLISTDPHRPAAPLDPAALVLGADEALVMRLGAPVGRREGPPNP